MAARLPKVTHVLFALSPPKQPIVIGQYLSTVHVSLRKVCLIKS